MRTLTSGLALALMGGLLIAPLGAAESRRQDGVISGSAAAEAKQPYSNYLIRGRDVTTNNISQTTTLDANADFALNSMMAGTSRARRRRVRVARWSARLVRSRSRTAPPRSTT